MENIVLKGTEQDECGVVDDDVWIFSFSFAVCVLLEDRPLTLSARFLQSRSVEQTLLLFPLHL